ncbi:hypothetical protein SAMN06269117_1265 [Balnearium lithotrophicum]|uniref:Haemolysin XhlA n=1 Tax=Balnearium lithotrophicum TaxID=223788 RepID=A0A521DX10_9BACT|nr:hypothetical protein [Balnearium lithotrophicum]SMO75410.1 hypothetical protein SAMN06269117_1265 [Balnearium lithotrophicum]
MAIDTEKLLLEIYGTVQEIKAELGNLKKEQANHADGMVDFEKRISRLERIVYAGIAVIAILEPILIEIAKHFIGKL